MPVFNLKPIILLWIMVYLSACASTSLDKNSMPARGDSTTLNQLGKNDFDRMADMEIEENTRSLRIIMTKLYKRNPHELAKSTSDPAQKMVEWVFDGESQHRWQFSELQNKQGTDAIFLAFDANYQGDRVLAFIVGLQTMLDKAHHYKKEFYFTDSLDPQTLYNVARNIEIAAWKLSHSTDINGKLYLVSNQMGLNQPALNNENLSFEREFGKMIGRTDFYAQALAEKSQRLISRIVQNLTTAVFLPF